MRIAVVKRIPCGPRSVLHSLCIVQCVDCGPVFSNMVRRMFPCMEVYHLVATRRYGQWDPHLIRAFSPLLTAFNTNVTQPESHARGTRQHEAARWTHRRPARCAVFYWILRVAMRFAWRRLRSLGRVLPVSNRSPSYHHSVVQDMSTVGKP